MFGGYEWMKITPANSSSALFLGVIWLMDTLDEENESDNIAAITEESRKEENKEQTGFIEGINQTTLEKLNYRPLHKISHQKATAKDK